MNYGVRCTPENVFRSEPFDMCDNDEKIKRLRNELKRLDGNIDPIHERINDLEEVIRKLSNHIHNKEGSVEIVDNSYV